MECPLHASLMAFSRFWQIIFGIRDLTKRILQDSGKNKLFGRGRGFDPYSGSGIRQTLGMGSSDPVLVLVVDGRFFTSLRGQTENGLARTSI